jgi:hypothetical protein
LGLFQIFTKICGDIHNFVFIAGINDTGDKLFTSVNSTNDYALCRVLIDSMTQFIAGNNNGGY